MAKTHKLFADELMNKSLDAADVVSQVSAEAGPLNKVGGNYQFETVIHRPRGHPKMYRVTVEEIY